MKGIYCEVKMSLISDWQDRSSMELVMRASCGEEVGGSAIIDA